MKMFIFLSVLVSMVSQAAPVSERSVKKVAKTPLQVGQCGQVEYYKYFDQNRVRVVLPVVSCQATEVAREKYVRTEKGMLFKKDIYEPVPNSTVVTYEIVKDAREFDSNLTREELGRALSQSQIIQEVVRDCQLKQQELMVKAVQNQGINCK